MCVGCWLCSEGNVIVGGLFELIRREGKKVVFM